GAGDLEGVNLSPQPPPRSGEGELRSPTVASAWWRTLGAWRARPEASHPSPKRGGAGGEGPRLNGPARGLRLHGDGGAQARVVGETGVGGSVLRIADSGAHADGEIGGGDRRTAGREHDTGTADQGDLSQLAAVEPERDDGARLGSVGGE